MSFLESELLRESADLPKRVGKAACWKIVPAGRLFSNSLLLSMNGSSSLRSSPKCVAFQLEKVGTKRSTLRIEPYRKPSLESRRESLILAQSARAQTNPCRKLWRFQAILDFRPSIVNLKPVSCVRLQFGSPSVWS